MRTPNRNTTLLEIAERIAAERSRLGLTQVELGKATQTNRNTIRRYETGESKPNPLFIADFEKVGGDATYILTGTRQDSAHTVPSWLAAGHSPEVIADKVLSIGDRRSAAYRRGLVDVLAFRLEGQRIHCPYQAGTTEFDAYFAGNERGHIQWRLMVEGEWKPQ